MIKKYLLGATLVILSIFLAFILFEISISLISKNRTVHNSNDHFISLELFPPNFRKQVIPSNEYLRQTDSFDNSRNYYIQTDKTGALVNPEDDNTFYNSKNLDILFLGGSTTENMFIREDLRFPALTASILNENKYCAPVNCTVLNAGGSGRIIPPSINILLNRYLVPRPKIVILMNNANDLIYLLKGEEYWSNKRHITKVSRYPLFNLTTYSRLISFLFPRTYALITNYIDKFLYNETKKTSEMIEKKVTSDLEVQIAEDYKESLNIFINICKTLNIKPILMTQPSRFKDANLAERYRPHLPGVTYEDFGRLHQKFNNIVRNYKNEGIMVIDLDKEIKPSKINMYDPVHLTNKGNQLAAEIITNDLLKNK